MSDLKKQAEELGIKVDGRWSDERLQAEIDEKLAADPEPSQEPSLVDDLPEAGPEPVIEVPVVEPVVEPAVGTPVVEPELVDDPESPVETVEQEQEQEQEQEREDRLLSAEEMADIERAAREASRDRSVVVTNLQANPMRSMGLPSYGSATFTERQIHLDPTLVARIERGVDLGLLKVEEQ